MQYDNDMSTDVAPVIQGRVERPLVPSHVSQPGSFPAHDFFNVVRTLVRNSRLHNQSDVEGALAAIDAYEYHVIPAPDREVVKSENDLAPIEDVSKRHAPSSVAAPPVPAGPAIDYDLLARAMVRAQQAQQANQEGDSEE